MTRTWPGARYFPDAGNVFLLIKPFASRTSVGGFFFWEDGEINRRQLSAIPV